MFRLGDTDVTVDRPFMSTAPGLNQACVTTVTSLMIVMVRTIVAWSRSLTFVQAQLFARFYPKGIMFRLLIYLNDQSHLFKGKNDS